MSVSGVSSNYVRSLQNQYQNRYDFTRYKPDLAKTSLSYGARDSYVNDDGIKYVTGIQNSAKALQTSLKDISKQETFNKMSAVSSSNEHMTVNASSNPAKDFETTSVDIHQVATTQTNKGAALKADDRYSSLGLQQFEIEVGGTRHQFSVRAELGDTNKDIQQKMASAINSKNIGVTATVSTDAASKTSTLNLESAKTGDDAKNHFTIRDRSGSLVANTGAANVTQQAQDAVYSVNGGAAKTSKSNTVDLGNGVTATLKKATTEAVSVSVQEDKAYGVQKVKDLVKGFNDLLSAAQTSTNGNTRLLNDLETTYQSYKPSLEKLGITADKDGKLTVDSKKLDAAAESGSLERFFTQYSNNNYGFANRLSKISSNVSSNPAYYVGSTRSSATSTASTSATSTESINPYTFNTENDIMSLVNSPSFNLKVYNQWYSMGYLFDMFV